MNMGKFGAVFIVLLLVTMTVIWNFQPAKRKFYPSVVLDKDILSIEEHIEREVPSIPAKFWSRRSEKWEEANGDCMLFGMDVTQIKLNNRLWQVFTEPGGNFYMFGAYFDDRKSPGTVRILGMFEGDEPSIKKYCQLWKKDSPPLVVPVTEVIKIWRKEWQLKGNFYYPYFINCQVPEEFSSPNTVSVVGEFCDKATNSLKVIYNKQVSKKSFGVCVKGLDFPDFDLSAKFIEWVELLKLLGADKIFVYKLQSHPNVLKALKHFETLNYVVGTDLTLPGNLPNSPTLQHLYLKKKKTMKRLNELITYNDCLYRNLYRYEYLALLDVDEVIMPKSSKDWKQIVQFVTSEFDTNDVSSFSFPNVYFFDNLATDEDIPKYMHFLSHTRRSQKYSPKGNNVKCFVSTDHVVTLHNHYPITCLGKCRNFDIDPSLAQLNHYRRDCVDEKPDQCMDYKLNVTKDTAIFKYKTKLIKAVAKTMTELGLLII